MTSSTGLSVVWLFWQGRRQCQLLAILFWWIPAAISPTLTRRLVRASNSGHLDIPTGLQIRLCISISKIPISSPNPMFDHLLESSHRDDSYKWSNIGFGEEITQVGLIEVYFTHLIWSPVPMYLPCGCGDWPSCHKLGQQLGSAIWPVSLCWKRSLYLLHVVNCQLINPFTARGDYSRQRK